MSASKDQFEEIFDRHAERMKEINERLKPKPKTPEEERAETRFWGMVALACILLGAAFISACLALVVLLWRLALNL